MCQIGLQLKAIHIRFLRSPRAVKVTLAAMLFGMPAAEASAPAFCAGPDTTILSLTTEVGDHIELEMTRYKDETKCPTYCLRAGVKFISKDGKLSQGWATGMFDGSSFFLNADWQNGANGMVIRGKVDNGTGTGIAYQQEWQQATWTAHTVNGCMEWPSDRQVIANCSAAAGYTRGLRHYVETRGGCGEHPAWEMCATRVAACDTAFSESGYQDFVGQCSAALANQPAADGASANSNSDPVAANCERFASNRDAEQACRTVISPDDFKKTAAGVCMQNSITTNSRRIQILENALGGGDPIPALTLSPNAPVRVDVAPQVFQGGGRGDPIPSITQPAYVPLRHGTPFLPSTEPAPSVVQPANTPLFRNGPSPAQIFRNGGCPPSMTPDGHGGCSGVSTVQPGGSAVPRPSASGTTASGGKSVGCPQYTIPDGHGGCSGSDTVQRGGISVPRSNASGGLSSTTTGVRRIDTNARTGILKSGGANAARPFPTPTTPSVSNNSVVLRRGSGAANAIRNQQFTPGLH